MPDAFYEALSDTRFRPTSATVGPWGPTLSHGSPPAALLVRAIERAFPRADARVARIAYDFFGPVPVAELEVATEMVRPGARIELSRARLLSGSSGGKTVMTASVWRIAVAPGRVPEIRDPRPVPALPPPQNLPLFVDVPTFGYGEALEWRFVEGRFDTVGPATVYARPKLPIVAGETVSPVGRLLLMVDSANGVSAELQPSRFTFVPVELTVSLLRHPKTDWAGMSARTTIDPDGVGHTRADLFDEVGWLGTAVQTLFVAPR